MHHYDPAERLIEIAVAAKRFLDVAHGDLGCLLDGSPHNGISSGEPVVQLSGFSWPGTLVRMAADGAEYRLSRGVHDGRPWTHLHVQVMGAWFWMSIGADQAAELMANEKAPAVAAAEA